MTSSSEFARVVNDMRDDTRVPKEAIQVSARRLAKIHDSWSRVASSCRENDPCYECSLKALRGLEALTAEGWKLVAPVRLR